MGTRSLTYFYEDDTDDAFMCMYRQYDGYPDGHGLELATFLKKFTIVNGFDPDSEFGVIANGMGCLAAQMVAHFKKEVGNHYLISPEVTDAYGQSDYEYHVYPEHVQVKCWGSPIFTGTYSDFARWAFNPPRDDQDDYIPIWPDGEES